MAYDFQSDYVPWETFIREWKWKQGQHLTAVGPTGKGKTTFLVEAIRKRDAVIFLATKKKDSTVDKLAKQGYKIVSDYREINPEVHLKYILKPPFPNNASAKELKELHQNVYREGLMYVFRSGGWCVVADEIRYLTDNLRLQSEMELLWLQGRSLKITIACATQRPRAIPLEAYDQATHLVFWRDNDRQNRQRLAEISGLPIDPREVMAEIGNLPGHQLLYINTVTGEGVRTQVDTGSNK